MNNIKIEGKRIGLNSPVFLIAEAGVNHNGEINLAKRMIDIAEDLKVDAIKFQTFNADDLILKTVPKVEYQKASKTDKETFYDLIKKLEFTKNQFKELKQYCLKRNLIFLSTPFDQSSVNLLDELGISAFKVSSGDMNNYFLLKLICSKKKPILLSTGMATLEEVKSTISFIKSNGIQEIVLFQCTTNYPASYEELNLNVIDTYKKLFPNVILGFSDHSLGIEASIAAVIKGVKVIEKHFTLDKNMKGPDHRASLNPEELKSWVIAIRNVERSLGSSIKKPSKKEIEIRKIARKSIISSLNLEKGAILNTNNITVKRPEGGIPPNEFYKIIGKRVKKDILKDTIIHWEDIE
ncbi:MAG: N-acetylneuraminate synthase [Promethearchaeota archaeon]